MGNRNEQSWGCFHISAANRFDGVNHHGFSARSINRTNDPLDQLHVYGIWLILRQRRSRLWSWIYRRVGRECEERFRQSHQRVSCWNKFWLAKARWWLVQLNSNEQRKPDHIRRRRHCVFHRQLHNSQCRCSTHCASWLHDICRICQRDGQFSWCRTSADPPGWFIWR